MRRTLSLLIAMRLRGQHVAHLGGADAERDGAERAVRRGVGIAAGDGRARLGDALFGADHVHDALLPAAEIEIGDSELLRVPAQFLDHVVRERVGEWLISVSVGTM